MNISRTAHICCYTDRRQTDPPESQSVVAVLDGVQPVWITAREADTRIKSAGDATVRKALEYVIQQTDATTVKLSRSATQNAGLTVGRLRPSLRSAAQTYSITVEPYPSVFRVVHKLAESPHIQEGSFQTEDVEFSPPFVAYADGSLRYPEKQATIGFVLLDSEGHVLRMDGKKIKQRQTSSEVEMAAVMAALSATSTIIPRSDEVTVRVDDERVPEVLNSDSEVSLGIEDAMEARTQYRALTNSHVEHVPREENGIADALAKTAHDHRVLWSNPAADNLKQKPEQKTKYSV